MGYEMITVSLKRLTQTVEETDYEIGRAGKWMYTQPERTTKSQRANNTLDCCLVTKSNKNIPSTTNRESERSACSVGSKDV